MSGLEVELKFLIDPEAWPAILAALPGAELRTKLLSAIYFDTPGRHLQAAGMTLRLRDAGGTVTQTVKQGHGPVRTEVEATRPDGKMDLSWPILRDRFGPRILGDLAPVFEVSVDRQICLVSSGASKIELAFDLGAISAGPLRAPVQELELELISGDPRGLFRLAESLSGSASLWLSLQQKAARGYRLADGFDTRRALNASPVPLDRSMRLKVAWQRVALAALDQILTNAALLRDGGGPEALHQFRVGLRRFKAARSTFRKALKSGPELPMPEVFEALSVLCGQARDLDVLMGRDDPPPALAAARATAHDQVIQAVSAPEFRALTLALVEGLICTDLADRDTDSHGLRHHARRILRRRRRRLESVGEDIARLDDTERHGLRIAAKTLRYAAEGFAGLFGEPVTQRYIRNLTRLQDALGDLNDLVTSQGLARDLGLTGTVPDGRKAQLVRQAQAAWIRLRSTPGFW